MFCNTSDFIWECRGHKLNETDLRTEHQICLDLGTTTEKDFYVWKRILQLKGILKTISTNGGKRLHENY